MKHLLSRHEVLKDIRKAEHEDIVDYEDQIVKSSLSVPFSQDSSFIRDKSHHQTQKIPDLPYNFQTE